MSIFVLLIVFQMAPGLWTPVKPIQFDTEPDCERARALVAMMTENTKTMCVEHRAA
jgi:hypothetical protein